MKKLIQRQRPISRRLLNYFLKGLLFVLPIFISFYVIYKLLEFLDGLLHIPIPGVGFAIVIGVITLLGYLGTGLLSKPFLDLFEDLMSRTPGLKMIYNSVKDMMEAFVGEKRKFKEPVMVTMSSTGIMKLGFVTQKDLSSIEIDGFVAVYFPHSYNFSGNLYLVPKDKVKPVEGRSAQMMQFIVSGGVTDLED